MKLPIKTCKFVIVILVLSCVGTLYGLEKLDRGLIALPYADGNVYIGWRLLISDPPDVAFDVLRCSEPNGEFEKLNSSPVKDSCNFVDKKAEGKSWYYIVRSLSDNTRLTDSEPIKSQSGETNETCVTFKLRGDYGANKLGIADLDGDGVYDYIIKQPAASIDPGRQRRSRGTYTIEAYNGRTGEFMWSHDLGWNINQGIWFSPVIVYDLDGDGRAEVACKSAPYAATAEEAFISTGGFVLEGPEYCSVLDGMTGKETDKVDWIARGNPEDWGDDRGNRVNRNQIAVAYTF